MELFDLIINYYDTGIQIMIQMLQDGIIYFANFKTFSHKKLFSININLILYGPKSNGVCHIVVLEWVGQDKAYNPCKAKDFALDILPSTITNTTLR